MSEDLEALRATVMSSLYKCAENSAMYLGEERTATLRQLQDHVAAYCNLDVQYKVAKEALEKAKTETNSTNIDSLDGKFKAHLQSMANRQCDVGSHPYMQQFNKKVKNAQAQRQQQDNMDDSDVAMTQTTNEHIDPITKKPIENPVKNRRCGHVYERDTIMQVLYTNRRLKCPVAGCGDKTAITEADLISDEELQFQMALTHHSTMAQL